MPGTATLPAIERDTVNALLAAGILTAVIDGLFSSVLSVVFYGSSVMRLFQGVASTLAGPAALTGGVPAAALGVLMHVGVAFGWSAVFLIILLRSKALRRVAASRHGALAVSAVYGPMIWMVMSLAVIPLLTGRPPNLGVRWWVQLVGHFPFVGVPIVGATSLMMRRQLRARYPEAREARP